MMPFFYICAHIPHPLNCFNFCGFLNGKSSITAPSFYNLPYRNKQKTIIMKTKISLFILAAAGITFASCSKCQLCTEEDSPEVRICRDDYGSESEYDAAIDFTEALGYDCSSSI
jgi:hypothetical protein